MQVCLHASQQSATKRSPEQQLQPGAQQAMPRPFNNKDPAICRAVSQKNDAMAPAEMGDATAMTPLLPPAAGNEDESLLKASSSATEAEPAAAGKRRKKVSVPTWVKRMRKSQVGKGLARVLRCFCCQQVAQ